MHVLILRQTTDAGRPLDYDVGDRRPLRVLCQNAVEFGSRRLVARPNGTVVR